MINIFRHIYLSNYLTYPFVIHCKAKVVYPLMLYNGDRKWVDPTVWLLKINWAATASTHTGAYLLPMYCTGAGQHLYEKFSLRTNVKFRQKAVPNFGIQSQNFAFIFVVWLIFKNNPNVQIEIKYNI